MGEIRCDFTFISQESLVFEKATMEQRFEGLKRAKFAYILRIQMERTVAVKVQGLKVGVHLDWLRNSKGAHRWSVQWYGKGRCVRNNTMIALR